MLLIVFFLLFSACIGVWAAGAPVWLVFALALATWAVFYLVIYPKVRTYKAAMGIDDALNSYEVTGWNWLMLHLAGLKVIVLGFVTSTIPFLGDAAQWLSGQNIDFMLDPSKPQTKQLVTFVIGAVVFSVPFLTSWLHAGAIADAAKSEPKTAETKG